MNSYRGQCHCGAVGFDYRTALPPEKWPMRRCQCTFCVKHGGVYTSDPAGSVRFAHADPSLLSRYRFGHKTADFVFCGRCGGFLGAIMEEGGRRFAVLSVRAMDPQPAGLPAPQPMSYEGETSDERSSRRAGRWTRVED